MAKQTFTTGQVLTAAQMTSLQQTAMGGGSATAKTASYVLVAADAGTTVAMNAAGATTITVNTALFAAGDTVFIQNLGAGACTVTAGTATVATAGSLILPQNDAGILYFTATGASIFYDYIQTGAVSPLTTKGDIYTFSTSDARIGVGANNTVLTADSAEATGLKWAAVAGGSMTLLSTTSLSGTSTTVSSISGAYKHLYIEVANVQWSGTVNDSARIATNLTSLSSYIQAKIPSNQGTYLGNGVDYIDDGGQYMTGDNGNNFMTWTIYNYASTTDMKVWDLLLIYKGSSSNGRVSNWQGGIYSKSAVNSFTYDTMASLTLTAGTIKIYGVN